MDLIDRKQVNNILLDSLTLSLQAGEYSKADIITDIMKKVQDLESVKQDVISYPPGIRGNDWQIIGTPKEFLYAETHRETDTNNVSSIKNREVSLNQKGIDSTHNSDWWDNNDTAIQTLQKFNKEN